MSKFRNLEHVVFVYCTVKLAMRIQREGLGAVARSALGVIIAGAKVIPGLSGVVEAEIKKEVDKIEEKMHGEGDPDAQVRAIAEWVGCCAGVAPVAVPQPPEWCP
jgi:hypothetical protein